jgi:hypothetical protein
MNYKFKYIIVGNSTPAPIIFGDLISHKEVAAGRFVKSAGFVYLHDEGAQCFGDSVSLGVKSDPEEDQRIIDSQFKLGEYDY